MKHSFLVSILLCGLTLVAVGCTKPDSGEDDTDSPEKPTVTLSSFRTSCGTIFKGQEENPISAKDGKRGTATVVGPNLLSMSGKKGSQLIKLHGLDVPYSKETREKAEAWLNSLVAEGEVYFYQAEPDCTVTLDDGTEGAVGALFSAKGKSFSESLLKKGFGQPTTDVCLGSRLASCYRALAEEAAPTPTPYPEFQGPSRAAGFILWKPVSDSDGRLAVHSVPYGTTVVVEGQKGRNQGAGNGYGSLARFSKPGCGYGQSVRLELVLSDGTNHMFGDNDFAVIPDGCKRWLIDQNGNVKADSKK